MKAFAFTILVLTVIAVEAHRGRGRGGGRGGGHGGGRGRGHHGKGGFGPCAPDNATCTADTFNSTELTTMLTPKLAILQPFGINAADIIATISAPLTCEAFCQCFTCGSGKCENCSRRGNCYKCKCEKRMDHLRYLLNVAVNKQGCFSTATCTAISG